MSEIEKAEELMNTFGDVAYEVAGLLQDQHDEQDDPARFLFWHRVKIYINARKRK
jgi:hypothetical protein